MQFTHYKGKGGKMTRKIYRSRKDYMIAGVCGGIAEYFDIDSTLVRLLAILIVFLGGAGIVAYIIAWIIIPFNPEQVEDRTIEQENSETVTQQRRGIDNKQGHIWGGLILIFLGSYFLLRSFFPRLILVRFWPIVLVVAGLVFIIKSFSQDR